MVYKLAVQVQTQSHTSLSDKRGLHPVMLVLVISFQSSSVYYIYAFSNISMSSCDLQWRLHLIMEITFKPTYNGHLEN